MTRTTWTMIVFSLFALATEGMLFAADPQRGGRGDRGRDGGGSQEDGRRGGINLPGVNVQPPRVQPPNVQAPNVQAPRGNINVNPSQPGRQAIPHGAARVAPPSGNVDSRGRAGGSVGAGARIPGTGIQVGPRTGTNFGGRGGFDARSGFDGRGRDWGQAGGRGDFNDRFLGGTSISLGTRSLNIAGGNYRPSYDRHRSYGGYWNFNNWGGGGWGGGWYGGGWGYGGWGGRGGYWGRPLGWGLGAWGLGSLIYNSGYLTYWNPYYGGGAIYDYAQPIPVAYYSAGDYAVHPAEEMLNAAIAAFRRTEYDAALSIVDQAISQYPDDSVLHEFRALVLFAKADYRQAAATIHSVLAVGPGWDWSTMSRLYSDVSVYTAQLRALEFYTKENPQDAAGLFLLGYHYLCTGHPDAAARKLQNVVELQPEDRVAADLLRMISSGSGSQAPAGGRAATSAPPQAPQQAVPQTPPPAAQPAPQPPAEAPRAAATPVTAAMLAGTWKAERDDGSKFELVLNPAATFTWKFSHKNTHQEFSGKYTLEGNVLALQRQDGGSLVGHVTPSGDGQFNFKLLGGPPEDTGLEFAR